MIRVLEALQEQYAVDPDRVRITDPDGREWTNRALLDSLVTVSREIEIRIAAGSLVAISVPSADSFGLLA